MRKGIVFAREQRSQEPFLFLLNMQGFKMKKKSYLTVNESFENSGNFQKILVIISLTVF